MRAWRPYGRVALGTLAGLVAAGLWTGWDDLWLSPDQRGRLLLLQNRPADAAAAFRDPLWRGVAQFRAGRFKEAAQAFAIRDTAEAAYDQGNALTLLGQYDAAVGRYDVALALRPGWEDAATNRSIAQVRGARLKEQGGPAEDNETPDQVVYDKTRQGGADTAAAGPAPPMSDEAIRALWLKAVQTRPADFLRARFAFQAAERDAGAVPP